MSRGHLYCNRSDALCPFMFIFALVFLMIALLIKFSYDSSKVKPLRNVQQQPNNRRLFEVTLNMPDEDDCPTYENLFGSPSSSFPSPMHRLSISSPDNYQSGCSTPARVGSPLPSPAPSPLPWLVVPELGCGYQPPPPPYSECTNLRVQHL